MKAKTLLSKQAFAFMQLKDMRATLYGSHVMNISIAHTYEVIQLWEELGLITRNKQHRKIQVQLTDKGRKVQEILQKINMQLQ